MASRFESRIVSARALPEREPGHELTAGSSVALRLTRSLPSTKLEVLSASSSLGVLAFLVVVAAYAVVVTLTVLLLGVASSKADAASLVAVQGATLTLTRVIVVFLFFAFPQRILAVLCRGGGGSGSGGCGSGGCGGDSGGGDSGGGDSGGGDRGVRDEQLRRVHPQQVCLIVMLIFFIALPDYGLAGLVDFWVTYGDIVAVLGDLPFQDVYLGVGVESEVTNNMASEFMVCALIFFWGLLISVSKHYTLGVFRDMQHTKPTKARPSGAGPDSEGATEGGGEGEGEAELATDLELGGRTGRVRRKVADRVRVLSCCQRLSTFCSRSCSCSCRCCGKKTNTSLRRVIGQGFPWRLLALLAFYFVAFVSATEALSFRPSLVPFVGLVSLWRVCSSADADGAGFCDRDAYPDAFERALAAGGLLLLDVCVTATVLRMGVVARRAMLKVPFALNRANYLGFAFIHLSSGFMWLSVLLMATFEVSLPPTSSWVLQAAAVNLGVGGDGNATDVAAADVAAVKAAVMAAVNGTSVSKVVNPLFQVGVTNASVAFPGIALVFAAWLAVVSFAFLPADSFGLKGWFVGSEQTRLRLASEGDVAGESATAKELADFFAEHPFLLQHEADLGALLAPPPPPPQSPGPSSTGPVNPHPTEPTDTTEPTEPMETLTGTKETKKAAKEAKAEALARACSRAVVDALAGRGPRLGADASPRARVMRQVASRVLVADTEVSNFNFAAAAYHMSSSSNPKSEAEEQAVLGGAEFRIVRHICDEASDTHVLVAEADDRVVVAFRGTVSNANMKTDLNLKLQPAPVAAAVEPADPVGHGDVGSSAERLWAAKTPTFHSGFQKAYASVRDELLATLAPLVLFPVAIPGEGPEAGEESRDGKLEEKEENGTEGKEDEDARKRKWQGQGQGQGRRPASVREQQQRAVFCVGHSLGGGLAVLCALDVSVWIQESTKRRQQGDPELDSELNSGVDSELNSGLNSGVDSELELERLPAVACSTFGCPRVGNWSFCERFRRRIPCARRFVLASDIIPKTPSRLFKGYYSGYQHAGLQLLLDLGGNLIVAPSLTERAMLHGLKHLNARMHFCTRYCLAIMLWCTRLDMEPKLWVVHVNAMVRLAKKDVGSRDPELLRQAYGVLMSDGVVVQATAKLALRTVGTQVTEAELAEAALELAAEREEAGTLAAEGEEAVALA